MIMQQLLLPLFNEVLSLPPTIKVFAVSVMGVLGVWMAMRNIDKNAG